MKMYVTYGCGSDRGGCYSVVEGNGYDDCRAQVEVACGEHFAFMYPEEAFDRAIAKYSLKEVPLGPQVMPKQDEHD
jgi:hypothetical protein